MSCPLSQPASPETASGHLSHQLVTPHLCVSAVSEDRLQDSSYSELNSGSKRVRGRGGCSVLWVGLEVEGRIPEPVLSNVH